VPVARCLVVPTLVAVAVVVDEHEHDHVFEHETSMTDV
jgi:hypothetical protein